MELPDFSTFDDKIDAIDIYVDYFVASYQRRIYEARIATPISKLRQLERMKTEVSKFKTIVESYLSPSRNQYHESIIRRISILSLSLTCLQTNIQIDDDTYQRFKFKNVYVSTEDEYEDETCSDDSHEASTHETVTEHFNSQAYIKLELNELLFFYRWTLFSTGAELDLSPIYEIINNNFSDEDLETYLDFLHQIEQKPFSTHELAVGEICY